jgi:hypothetical protein
MASGRGNRWVPIELWLQSRRPPAGRGVGVGRGALPLIKSRLPPVHAERTR